jgi:hypothetical protein
MSYTTERTPNHTTNNYTTVSPQRSGSGVALAIGALVALVAIIAYFVVAQPAPSNDSVSISVDAPAAVENSAERVGDAAAGAAEAVGDAAAGAAQAVEGAAERAAGDTN